MDQIINRFHTLLENKITTELDKQSEEAIALIVGRLWLVNIHLTKLKGYDLNGEHSNTMETNVMNAVHNLNALLIGPNCPFLKSDECLDVSQMMGQMFSLANNLVHPIIDLNEGNEN